MGRFVEGDGKILARAGAGRDVGAVRTVIYPGSFDPITNGHLDVIERAPSSLIASSWRWR